MNKQPEKRKPRIDKKYINNFLRGVIKSTPALGAFLEQIIYGVIDDTKAQQEKDKLYTYLFKMFEEIKKNHYDMKSLLNDIIKNSRLLNESQAEIKKITHFLNDPDNVDIPKKLLYIVAQQEEKKSTKEFRDKFDINNIISNNQNIVFDVELAQKIIDQYKKCQDSKLFISYLSRALNIKKDPSELYWTYVILGNIGGKDSIEIIKQGLSHNVEFVRLGAKRALEIAKFK